MRSNRQRPIRFLCQSAAIAGLYAVLTLLLSPISFGAGGAFQVRISEALTLLPILTPAAVPGLFAGCLTANLLCGSPLPDVLFGSLATLLAAFLTRKFRRKRLLAALSPVVCNGLIVGVMLERVYTLPLGWGILTVTVGELIACLLLGLPFLKAIEKTKIFGE